jgi:chemotaxis-related protein WspB
MVYLLIQIGADRYALEAAALVTVLPRVRLKRIPQAAQGVAGVFNFHGEPVPVVDLSAMALGAPSEESLSTRLVLVGYQRPGGPERLLGLLAEKAIDTARYNPVDFQDSGVTAPQAPYLGPVIHDAHGIVQLLELERLLTPEVREALWQQAREMI